MEDKNKKNTLEYLFEKNNKSDGNCYCPIPIPDKENKVCLTCHGINFKIKEKKKKKWKDNRC